MKGNDQRAQPVERFISSQMLIFEQKVVHFTAGNVGRQHPAATYRGNVDSKQHADGYESKMHGEVNQTGLLMRMRHIRILLVAFRVT